MRIEEQRLYFTDSLYEASFLLANGFPHRRTENSNSQYKKIVFDDSSDLRKVIASFYGNGKVPVLAFVSAYKKLKGEVFQNAKS